MVQERGRVKDLFSLVGYDDSCVAAIRYVKSIIRVIQPSLRSGPILAVLKFSYVLANGCYFQSETKI